MKRKRERSCHVVAIQKHRMEEMVKKSSELGALCSEFRSIAICPFFCPLTMLQERVVLFLLD